MNSVPVIDSVSAADAAAASALAPELLRWFDIAGRKDLPWQRDTTSYRVWASEIMLQQTQVVTVIPYYERFMQRFPNVQSLAQAPIDEVLHLWTGLGYYARARNLHRAAQMIVAEHDGEFPRTLEAVQALPGIGRSTAGAILALSQAQRHPILDGNVKRVLTRYFSIAGFPGEQKIERELWRLAEACTPQQRVGNYTQAIMDLGATLCVRSRPRCPSCPLAAHCVARAQGTQSVLPTPKPKKSRPQRVAYVVIVTNEQGAVLLERRPPAGIWGGLWTFPQFDERTAAMEWSMEFRREESEGARPTRRGAGIDLSAAHVDSGPDAAVDSLPAYHHSFTHFELTLHPLVVRVVQQQGVGVADGERHLWYDPQRPAAIGLAKPAVDLIKQLGLPRQAGLALDVVGDEAR